MINTQSKKQVFITVSYKHARISICFTAKIRIGNRLFCFLFLPFKNSKK